MIWRLWAGSAALLGICVGLYVIGMLVRPMIVPLFVLFVIASCFIVPYRGRVRKG